MGVLDQNAAIEAPFHLGILNCVLGFFGIILSAVAMGLPNDILKQNPDWNFVGTGEGIWCGICLLLTGTAGILTGVKATTSNAMYIASGALGIITALVNLAGFGLCAVAFFVYSYVLWNVTFISLYIVIGSLCFAGVPLCIMQAAYSFSTRNYNMESGGARFEHSGNEGTVAVNISPNASEATSKSSQPYVNVMFGLGITELVIGFLIFCLDIACVSITVEETPTTNVEWLAFGYNGIGIWGGLYICLSGALGVVYSYMPSPAMINTNMSLSMLASATSVIMLVVHAFAAITPVPALIGLHITIALLAFSTTIICIVHSVFCCKANGKRRQAIHDGVTVPDSAPDKVPPP